MRRPRLTRIASLLLVLSLCRASVAHGQTVQQLEDRELARRRFDEGLMFVDRRDYARALAAFQEAYRLQPHPIALYNIGQAYQALDRPAEAVEALQRYLDESPELPADRRAAVEQQLRALKLKVRPTPPAPPSTKAAPAVTAAPAPPGSPRRGPALVAGGGAALVATAIGLRVWNDSRYGNWQRQRTILSQRPEPTSPAEADIIDTERARSNQRLEKIQRTDDIVWALVAAGSAAVVGGVVWWLSRRPAHATRAEPGPFGW